MAKAYRMRLFPVVGFLIIAFCQVVVSEAEAYGLSSAQNTGGRSIAEIESLEVLSEEDNDLTLESASAESDEEADDIDDLVDRERRSYGGQQIQQVGHYDKLPVRPVPPVYKQQPAEPLHIDPKICYGVGPRQDVLFSHPQRCDKYMQCVHGAPMVRDCGPGTYWIPNRSYCGHWRDSFCANVIRLPDPTTTCRCNDFVIPVATVTRPSPPVLPPSPVLPAVPQPPIIVQPPRLPQPVQPPIVSPLKPVVQPGWPSPHVHTGHPQVPAQPLVPAARPPSPPVSPPRTDIVRPVPLGPVVPVQPVPVPVPRPPSPPLSPQPWPVPPSPPSLGPAAPALRPVQPLPPVSPPQPVPAPGQGLLPPGQFPVPVIPVPHINPAICLEAGPRLDVIFAHPQRCDQYIQCVHGRPDVRSCGPGTYFDPRAKNCGFWQTSYCANNMRIAVPTQTCTCNDYKLDLHAGWSHHKIRSPVWID